MKYYFSIVLLIVFNEISLAQTSANLNIHNANAIVNTVRRSLFNYSQTYSAGYEIPKGSGNNTIYATQIWIGGMDINSNLHLAAETFSSGADFVPGPVMDSIHYASQIPLWNRVWKVNKADINFHLSNYTQPGYIVPSSIADWPAHGNTSLGQATNLAPFEDINQNGIYEPTLGDYPQIPGDECIFYIGNDDTIHTETGGEKMKIEIHYFVYAFDCPSDSALYNTTFVKYKIFNRSDNDYYNTAIGIWADLDIGGAADDFVGSSVRTGSFYGYNGDAFDNFYQGQMGYDSLLPFQAISILAGPYADNDALDNPFTTNITNAIDSAGIPYTGLGMNYDDGIIDNERLGLNGFRYYNNAAQGGNPATIDPNNAINYFKYLNALWLDSTNMVYGGTAHQSSAGAILNGLIPCSFMFPLNSDPLLWNTSGASVVTTDWNEFGEGNISSDRRGLGWTGNFTFESGSVEELDVAFVFAIDYQNTGDTLASFDEMETRVIQVRDYFNQNQTPCGGMFQYLLNNNEIESDKLHFDIYPNPSSSNFTLSYNGAEKNLSYSIHDILGKEFTSGKILSENTSIDCSKWSRGVYLIKIGNENGYSVEKIIVE